MAMPPPTHKQPVAMAAWVAASQPELGPVRRGVLQAVAEMSQDGGWVPSNQIKERFGTQRQSVNRHLRSLESSGLLLLESRGKGLPLYVRITSAGQRALNLRGPLAVPAPETAPSPAQSAPLAQAASLASAPQDDQPAPQAPPHGGDGRLERLTQSLYDALSNNLEGVGYLEFGRILRRCLVQSLRGTPQESTPARTAAPVPQDTETTPEPAAATAAPEPLAPAQATPAAPPAVSASLPIRAAFMARPVPDGPPVLNPAEASLEQRLLISCHGDYRDQLWWERTKDFSTLWDQTNRWRRGSLGTSFTSFGPRWHHPDWRDFNQARRQADAHGASYADWIQAQFDRLEDAVAPADLQGEEAAAAWRARVSGQQPTHGSDRLGEPPYTQESFNVFNPDHAAYAESLLLQIASLAQRVYGDDPDGVVRLLSQAVAGGNLPVGALDLRPQLKPRVLAALGPRYSEPPVAQPTISHGFSMFNDSSPGKPSLII